MTTDTTTIDTTTTITVPREFLREFAGAATWALRSGADVIGTGAVSGATSRGYSDETREHDDAQIAQLLRRVDARETILRALDDDSPVPVAILQGCVDELLDDLRCSLGCMIAVDGFDAGRVAVKSALLRDITTWCAENDITAAAAPVELEPA